MKQATLEDLVLTPQFKVNDIVYLLYVYRNVAQIAKGRVVNVYQVDNLNTKYLVQGVTFSVWAYDTELFESKEALLEDFGSVVRE